MYYSTRELGEHLEGQIKRLLDLGYHEAAGKTRREFLENVNPLWDKVKKGSIDCALKYKPLLLVIPFKIVSAYEQLRRIAGTEVSNFSLSFAEETLQSAPYYGAFPEKPYLIWNAAYNSLPPQGEPVLRLSEYMEGFARFGRLGSVVVIKCKK